MKERRGVREREGGLPYHPHTTPGGSPIPPKKTTPDSHLPTARWLFFISCVWRGCRGTITAQNFNLLCQISYFQDRRLQSSLPPYPWSSNGQSPAVPGVTPLAGLIWVRSSCTPVATPLLVVSLLPEKCCPRQIPCLPRSR